MSRQNKNGTWIIPEEQAQEFENGINWNALISACIKQPYHKTLKVDGCDIEKDSKSKKKSIWNKEITIFGM